MFMVPKARAGLVALAVLLLVQCGGSDGPPQAGNWDEHDPDTRTVVKASNRFGLDLLNALYDTAVPGNVLVSPVSISMALTMAWNGARGSTADSMAAVLGITGLEQQAVNAANATLLGRFLRRDRRVQIKVANSVWVRAGTPVPDSFARVLRDYYAAHADTLDFADPGAVGVINDWVREKTRGLIPVAVDHLDDVDLLLLMNAVFFKGIWRKEFDPKHTGLCDFYLVDGTPVQRTIMAAEPEIRYFVREDLAIARLPYKSDRWAMYILVPGGPDGYEWYLRKAERDSFQPQTPGAMLAGLLHRLTLDSLEQWLSDMDTGNCIIGLPRFTLDYDVRLDSVLPRLGMGHAFSSRADFSGIAQGFHLTKVLHRAVIEVDEHGTTAAAVTGGAISGMPPVVVADHPFLFLIRDDVTKAILFMGVVTDPKS